MSKFKIGSSLEETVALAMARAFFVSAWADNEEENGRNYPGKDLMEVAPETPEFVVRFAYKFLGRIEQANDTNIYALVEQAAVADRYPKDDILQFTRENRLASYQNATTRAISATNGKYVSDFGHYLAMEGLGHGVSWFDDHGRFEIEIPLVEFHYSEIPASELEPITLNSLLAYANELEIDSEQLYSAVADSDSVPMSDDRLEIFGDLTLEEQIAELGTLVTDEQARKVIREASEF